MSLKKIDLKKKALLVKLSIARGFCNAKKRRRKKLCNYNEHSLKSKHCSFYFDQIQTFCNKSKRNCNSVDLHVPENFSIIENCDNTLEIFDKLVCSVDNNKVKNIRLDQSRCQNIDLCAETVAAVLLKDVNSISKKKKVKICGNFPLDDNLMKIVGASGVTKYLGISSYNPPDMLLFDLREGRKSKSVANQSTEKEIQAGKLIDYLNLCLNRIDWELNRSGKQYLGKIIAEVLDNAECHSKRSSWWINAYLKTNGPETGECHLVIFNFGMPIAESLREVLFKETQHEKTLKLRTALNDLIKQHSKRKLFSAQWDENVLLTLYSLQEGVSSKLERDSTRGNGLTDLIEFFQLIGKSQDKEPVMALLSGDVFIKFDNEYELKHVKGQDSDRRQIAFNKENSLSLPPDVKKVKKIKHYFPGTLYSFKFYIDKQYMEILKNGRSA